MREARANADALNDALAAANARNDALATELGVCTCIQAGVHAGMVYTHTRIRPRHAPDIVTSGPHQVKACVCMCLEIYIHVCMCV